MNIDRHAADALARRAADFAASRLRVPPGTVDVRITPLRGGLESSVSLVRASAAVDGRPASIRFVLKRVAADRSREVSAYAALAARGILAAPALLGHERTGAGEHYVYLEYIAAVRAWPWREPDHAASVLSAAARLHASGPLPELLSGWDYESELLRTAGETLVALERAAAGPALAPLRPRLRHLRKIVDSLPAIRRALLEEGAATIHGDLHPGNVILRMRHRSIEPVLLDWGRARRGAPEEDVACWLQSLGCYEPEARRRHDALFRAYRRARGLPDALTPEVRERYWLAGACNGLAGALGYHAAKAMRAAATPRRRGEALRAAGDWLRVMRRAAACLA